MGEIRCYTMPRNRVRAVAHHRDFDGITRQIERTGRSETAARNRLKEACRDRGRSDAAADITHDTTVKALAEQWFSEIAAATRAGEHSPSTWQTYRDQLDNQLIPALGALRLREVTVSRVDRVLKATREHHGVSVARITRTVLSGMFGLATRHDAMPSNPVRDAAPVRQEGKVLPMCSNRWMKATAIQTKAMGKPWRRSRALEPKWL
jgi:hypothetical protein